MGVRGLSESCPGAVHGKKPLTTNHSFLILGTRAETSHTKQTPQRDSHQNHQPVLRAESFDLVYHGTISLGKHDLESGRQRGGMHSAELLPNSSSQLASEKWARQVNQAIERGDRSVASLQPANSFPPDRRPRVGGRSTCRQVGESLAGTLRRAAHLPRSRQGIGKAGIGAAQFRNRLRPQRIDQGLVFTPHGQVR